MSKTNADASQKLAVSQPIFIIDDDPLIADCIKLAALQGLRNLFAKQSNHSSKNSNQKTQSLPNIEIFPDAVAAINATSSQIPALIFLDVLLTGPNGFTLLNELASYPETAEIPIVLVSSLDLSNFPLKHYNIVQVLSKDTMTPAEIGAIVEEYYAK